MNASKRSRRRSKILPIACRTVRLPFTIASSGDYLLPVHDSAREVERQPFWSRNRIT
jgi:hypothetical protein